jgi:hypothetical protein
MPHRGFESVGSSLNEVSKENGQPGKEAKFLRDAGNKHPIVISPSECLDALMRFGGIAGDNIDGVFSIVESIAEYVSGV